VDTSSPLARVGSVSSFCTHFWQIVSRVRAMARPQAHNPSSRLPGPDSGVEFENRESGSVASALQWWCCTSGREFSSPWRRVDV